MITVLTTVVLVRDTARIPAGAIDVPVEMSSWRPLNAKDIKRASFEDLTANPWAGSTRATSAHRHRWRWPHGAERTCGFHTCPERIFFNPVARALVDERKKLLQHPLDDALRDEAANLMAGVAHDPGNYHGDPVVLMALRTGAVRLVLNHDQEVVPPVNDILWQTAVRIEDGAVGMAEQNLRQAQKELADALDRNASEQEIQQRIDALHQALTQFLSELSMRAAKRPGPIEDLSQLSGTKSNMLTPKDLDRMLEQMRDLSATGARDAARQELSRLQQLLENLRTDARLWLQLNAQQRAALENLKTLRALAQDQRQLLDKTFQQQNADKKSTQKLVPEQSALHSRLLKLLDGMKGDENASSLAHGSDAMQRAGDALQAGAAQGAVPNQNEALKAMQQARTGR